MKPNDVWLLTNFEHVQAPRLVSGVEEESRHEAMLPMRWSVWAYSAQVRLKAVLLRTLSRQLQSEKGTSKGHKQTFD